MTAAQPTNLENVEHALGDVHRALLNWWMRAGWSHGLPKRGLAAVAPYPQEEEHPPEPDRNGSASVYYRAEDVKQVTGLMADLIERGDMTADAYRCALQVLHRVDLAADDLGAGQQVPAPTAELAHHTDWVAELIGGHPHDQGVLPLVTSIESVAPLLPPDLDRRPMVAAVRKAGQRLSRVARDLAHELPHDEVATLVQDLTDYTIEVNHRQAAGPADVSCVDLRTWIPETCCEATAYGTEPAIPIGYLYENSVRKWQCDECHTMHTPLTTRGAETTAPTVAALVATHVARCNERVAALNDTAKATLAEQLQTVGAAAPHHLAETFAANGGKRLTADEYDTLIEQAMTATGTAPTAAGGVRWSVAAGGPYPRLEIVGWKPDPFNYCLLTPESDYRAPAGGIRTVETDILRLPLPPRPVTPRAAAGPAVGLADM